MDFYKNAHTFLQELKKFQYELDGDRIWRMVFSDKKDKWHKLHIQQYKETFYISLIDGDVPTLEIQPSKKVETSDWHRNAFGSSRFDQLDIDKQWEPLISAARIWLKRAERDWIKANALAIANYPANRRKGYVPHSIIRALVPDIHRLDRELGKKNTAKFIKLHESRYFGDREKQALATMTARTYFDYCKIAYIAAKRKDDHVDETLSGLEMYQCYADGRHEGLLDIDLDSEEEFAAWIDGTHPKRDRGGHPWEIKRGGNTTHIDLSVSRPYYYEKKGFIVTVGAHAISHLAEAIRMFLALHATGLPITIGDPDAIAKRLLVQDNIGIVPCYESLHRANQDYAEDQEVHDVMYYDDLGRYKRRIKPFITWHPLPLLIPNQL